MYINQYKSSEGIQNAINSGSSWEEVDNEGGRKREEELLVLILYVFWFDSKNKELTNTEECININIMLLLWLKTHTPRSKQSRALVLFQSMFDPCIHYLLLHLQTLRHKITHIYYLLSFCGLEIWARLSRQPGNPGLVSSEGSPVGGCSSKVTPKVIGRIQFLKVVGQGPPSVPRHVVLSTGQLTAWQLASFRVRKGKPQSFGTWISEMTSPWVCRILFMAKCP